MAQSAASELPWCDLCGGGDSSGPERVYAKSSQAPADIDDAPVVMADNTRADSGERVELVLELLNSPDQFLCPRCQIFLAH